MATDSVPGGTSSTSAVPVGGSTSGTIDISGDQDWYRVSLLASQQYRFDLRGSASGLGTLVDPYLRLLDASGATVASDDDSGTGLDSSITFTAVQTADYYLSAEVSPFEPPPSPGQTAGRGTFELSATDVTAQSGDVPASVATTSQIVAGGERVTGTIDSSGDQDWYQVSLVAGRQYRFELQGFASGLGTLADPYLRLLDASGTELAYNDDSGFGLESSITYTAGQSATYYLSAQSFVSGIGTFALSAIEFAATSTDVAANTGTTATVLVDGSVTGAIDTSGDEDWYQVSLLADHQYRFDLRGSASGQGTLADPYLRLLDSQGVQIGFNDDAGGTLESSITFTASQSGTYFLSAQGFASNAGGFELPPSPGQAAPSATSNTGTFDLSVSDLGAAPGDVPANAATGSTLTVGSSVTGSIEVSDDQDWYQVSLVAGHYYRFDLQGATANLGTLIDPRLRLLDSSGVQLTYNDDANSGYSLDSSIAFTADQTGTYFLSAQSNDTRTGTFVLSAIELTGGTGDVPASTGTASTVAVDATLAGSIDVSGDQDWYQISLLAAHQYRFDLRGSASNEGTLADPYLRLLDSSGLWQLAFDDDSGTGLESSFTYTPDQSGTYLLSAQGAMSNTGTFALAVADLSAGSGDVAQDSSTGSSLSVGGSVTGTLAASDQDWYRVALIGGHSYRFNLQGYDSDRGTLADPTLRLLDSSGTQLASDDDSGTGLEALITYTANQSGTYFLSAQAFAGYSSGTFTLSATDTYADVAEGTGTSGAVAPSGASVTDLIDASGDQDWYRVSLVAGHRYAFDLQGATSGQNPLADPLLRLLDGTGNEIAYDDDSGSSLDSTIQFTAELADTYFLSAEGYSSSAGVFTLSAFDFDDPGEVVASTSSESLLPIGGSIRGTIDTGGDQDWYRVALVSGHTYRLDLQGAESGNGSLADPLVRLLDSSGTEVFSNDNALGTLDSVLAGTATEGGTYFISVQGSGSSTGTYTVSVADITSLAGDIPAGTSTTRTLAVDMPTSVPSGYRINYATGIINGNDGTAGSYDDDWFQVTLSAGHMYEFDLLGVGRGYGTLNDPFLQLYDSSGSRLAYDDNSLGYRESSIIYSAAQSGTYYLSAGGSLLTDIGSFTLLAQDLTGTGEIAASATTSASAFVGSSLSGMIDTSSDQDWYRISLTAGHQYEFAVQGSAYDWGTLYDPYLRLLDASGAQIDFDDNSGTGGRDASIKFAATASGTYYLSAQAAGSGTGSFLLGVADITVSSGDVLGTPATNYVVAVGGEVIGAIDQAGDQDWYQVALTAGQTYHFDLLGVESEQGTLVDPYLRLLNSTGTQIAYDDDSGAGLESRIRYIPTASGTYLLSAEGWESNTGTFVLGVLEGADVVLGSTATHTRLAVGSSLTGKVDATGDQDWYRVELLAGHEYTFRLKGAASGHGTIADPILSLLDFSGTEIDYSDIAGTSDESITYTADRSGVYFLSAQGYSAYLGTYTLDAIDTNSADVAANTSTLGFLASAGSSVTGAIDASGDQDWYQVSLVAGHQYQFDLQGAGSGLGTLADSYLRLLNSAGTQLDFNEDYAPGLESRITYTPSASGTYFLSAQGSGQNSGTYTISTADLTGGDVPGSTLTDSAVAVGGSITGTIGTSVDEDWYQVSLVSGHQYRFDLSGATSGAGTLTDTYLRLFDSTGAELAYDDDSGAGLESSIAFTASQSGNYFLSARGYSSQTGTFALRVTDLTGDTPLVVGTSGNDVLRGARLNDELQGLGGADQLDGKGGDDILDGGAGDDQLSGGRGNDTLTGADGNDVFLASTLESAGDDTLVGGAGNDVFGDPYGSNVLDGGAGDDRFSVHVADDAGSNTVTGGSGQDTYQLLPGSFAASDLAYVVTDFEVGIGGDLLDLDGLIDASTRERYFSEGSSSALDFLRLLQSGANTLVQWDRDGVALDGYAWATQLMLKNVDATKINSYNFPGAVDIGTKSDDRLAGGEGNDSIYGAAGDDILNGGGGADYLAGGSGADLYYVDDAKDVVVETDNSLSDSDGIRQQINLGSAIDTVVSSINYALGSNLENLILTGTANLTGSGNLLNNAISGNAGSNDIDGDAGDDILDGGAGSDSLDGGDGIDTAVFAISSAQATLAHDADGWTVHSQQDTDRLNHIEYLQFTDQTIAVPVNASPSGTVTLSGAATENVTLTFASTLEDADGLGTLSCQWQRSSDGSTWNSIAGATASSYLLDDNDVGTTIRVLVSYADGKGTPESVASSASGVVANVNDAPTLATAFADRTATKDSAFSFTFAASAFVDADAGDTLNYSAAKSDGTALPAWLTFDAGARTFSGTPGASDSGTISVKVTATDTGNASASDVFALTVPDGTTSTLWGKTYFWNKVAAQGNNAAGHVLMDGVAVCADYGGTEWGGTTAAGGAYSVTNIAVSIAAVTATQAYSTADKATVTLGDALEVLKLYLGKLSNPSPYKYLASDFNADNKVTLTDALGILKSVLNKTGALEPAWVFVDEEANLSALTKDSATRPAIDAHPVATDPSLNLVAVLRGDANGSWKPAATTSYEVLADGYFTDPTTGLVGLHPDYINPGQFGL